MLLQIQELEGMRALSKQGRRLIPPYDSSRRLPCELEAIALMPEADGSWQVPGLLHLLHFITFPSSCTLSPRHRRLQSHLLYP